jgi:hypothetical protein
MKELTIKLNFHESLTLYGESIAGNKTCIVIPKLNLVFDIGFLPDIAI